MADSDRIALFLSKTAFAESGCRLWMRAKTKDGYGVFSAGPGRRGSVLAHRWAYAHFVGEIPKGHYVLHSCDVPACVNPTHLFTGTQRDNVKDCADKGRRNQTRYRKLSADLHSQIRERYAGGDVSQATLAREYGVAQASISWIIRRSSGYVRPTSIESGRRRGTFSS